MTLESYNQLAQSFICTLIPGSSSSHIQYTPGGLIYKPGGSNLQHGTSISFLLLAYANYLSTSSSPSSSASVDCPGLTVGAAELRRQAKSQADYILGDNPLRLSFMVGFTDSYPNYIHHRGSSLPSIRTHPEKIACKEGSNFFNSPNPNPNVLIGAVVGGPDEKDEYNDTRVDYQKSEPTTYINAPFVGVLAYFAANHNDPHSH